MTDVAIEAVQEVDAVPVVGGAAGSHALVRSVPAPAQALAVAAGGFLAGVAVVGLAARRSGRPAGRRRGRGARRVGRGRVAGRRQGAGELVRIIGTRSLLVDVHLLDSPRR
ncbi:MAG TPA: hypothetical protein VMG80_00315 [Solirubrobacteraceae bacterium]|nr:hypothetical protein [Solirubrobacteraceae bacterium]